MDDDTLSILGYHHVGGYQQDILEGIVFVLKKLTGGNHQTFYVLQNIAEKTSCLSKKGHLYGELAKMVRATFLNSEIPTLVLLKQHQRSQNYSHIS